MQSLHISISDISKIPELMEHFEEHQVNYGDSFLTFINKHYGGKKEQHDSENNDDHENLPFHHTQHVCVDLKMDFPILLVVNESIQVSPKQYFHYEEPHTASSVSNLLDPPKVNC
jgi:hypothetical protein